MAQVMMLLRREDLYRLNSLTDNENAVITALLRNYGGLFTDYCYIDESLIAAQSNLTKEETYAILKNLSMRRILHFIPRKKIPHVTYKQRREESNLLIFPPEVYDKRKQEYTERIYAMINYAENNDICRSRLLLRYFGEKRSTDCGQCDVCIAHNGHHAKPEDIADAKKSILDLLSDGCRHLATEINKIRTDREVLKETLEYLISEEIIHTRDGMIFK